MVKWRGKTTTNIYCLFQVDFKKIAPNRQIHFMERIFHNIVRVCSIDKPLLDPRKLLFQTQ